MLTESVIPLRLMSLIATLLPVLAGMSNPL